MHLVKASGSVVLGLMGIPFFENQANSLAVKEELLILGIWDGRAIAKGIPESKLIAVIASYGINRVLAFTVILTAIPSFSGEFGIDADSLISMISLDVI